MSMPSLADKVSVRLEGVDGPVADNVLAQLSLAALADRGDLSEAAIRRLHRRAPAQIERALQPFGHYQPTIERRLRRGDLGEWTATYTITPGPLVRVGDVSIEVTGPGRNNSRILEVIARQRIQTGAPLRHEQYEALKGALRRAAMRGGYLDAAYTTHELRVDPEALRADIRLALQTGPRFLFGEVSLEQDALTDSLVRRYLDIEAGQPFDQSKLLDAQYALQDSGFFSAVEVHAERERTQEQRVPIRITATARKRQRYSFGIGYSSDVGARVSAGWENRRINDRGHRANVDLRVSAPRTELTTRYSRPFGDPRTDRYVWSFAHRVEDFGDDTASRRQEVGATQTRVLGEWQRNLYLQLTREVSEIADIDSTDLLLLPGISMTRTRSDDAVQPRHAHRLSGDLRGSHSALGSNTDFLRLKLETRLIRPAGRGRLLLRGDIGATAVSEFSRLPASQRFFTGGDRSVRGYGFNELGPRDSEGRNIGGHYFFAGSVELEWPIAGRWSAAAFVDAGNAYDQLDAFAEQLQWSVGLGGRLRTPVGVIRLDLAKPVAEGGQSVRLHIGLGPDL